MALRAGYKGVKKLLAPLKIIRPGTLGIDNGVLIPELNKTFFPRSEQAVLGAVNLAKSVHTETFTEQYYRALNIEFDIQPNTEYTFSFDAPSGNKYYFNDSLFTQGKEVTTDGTRKSVTVTTKSTIDNTQRNVTGWYILKNSVAQSSSPSFSDVMINLGSVTYASYVPFAMTNKELTEKVQDLDVKITSIECDKTAAGTYTLSATVDAQGAVTYVWTAVTP